MIYLYIDWQGNRFFISIFINLNCSMMKKLFLMTLVLGALAVTGCKKDEMKGSFQLGGESYTVTGAVAYLYSRDADETNYELYLLMDGTTMESEYGSAMYIDLYFPGSVNELQAGTYRIGEVVCQWAEFASYTQTDEIYHEIMPGSVTIEKSGNNYTISCSGTADNGESVSCSYTGPVQYVQDEYSEVSYAKRMSARKK